MNVSETLSHQLTQKLEQRGYSGQMALGYLDAINDLLKIEDRESPKQPQLDENQQKGINRLTINFSWYGKTAQHALHATLQEPEMPDLQQNEFAQVLEVFSKWVQDQGEK